MTVSNQDNSISYTGNGVTTVFPWAFLIESSADIEVVLYNSTTMTETTLTYGVDYTATGLDNPAGGSVTYNPSGTPIPSTKVLTVRRVLDLTQDLHLVRQTNYDPTLLEEQLDRIVMMVQQVSNEVTENSLTIPPGSGLTITDILNTSAAAVAAAASATASAATATAAAASVTALLVGLGKMAVARVATTAAITISTALNNGDTIDGVVLATGDVVLVKDQAAPAQNGIYIVGVVPARSASFNTWASLVGSLIVVSEGTTNADRTYICTSDAGGTIDVTAVAYAQTGSSFASATEMLNGTLTTKASSPAYASNSFGQCQLTKVGANLSLARYGGTKLFINGVFEVLPTGLVTLAAPSDTVTMTIATPGVVTWNAHGLVAGSAISFSTSGALPTGVTAGTVYYVIATGLTANTFQFSATVGGAAVNTSGSQSGVHKIGTMRYIYAYMNAGTMTLENSTTVPATDATYGHQIKTGDATRTLVGMAMDRATAWVDSATQRFVLSYFNRRNLNLQNAFTASQNTTSLTIVEVSTSIRCEFLTWVDESVRFALNAPWTSSVARAGLETAIGYDGTTPDPMAYILGSSKANAGDNDNHCLASEISLAVGYHYVTLLGREISSGTLTYLGAAANSARTSLVGSIRG